MKTITNFFFNIQAWLMALVIVVHADPKDLLRENPHSRYADWVLWVARFNKRLW